MGAGLDNGRRMRRGRMDSWKYIYLEQNDGWNLSRVDIESILVEPVAHVQNSTDPNIDPDSGISKKHGVDWEVPPIMLPPILDHRPHSTPEKSCDPDYPRIFHMFWTGPFTDKPYTALLSFLFTQNLCLHMKERGQPGVCRPKFWLWINPGPAAAVPNPTAVKDMFEQLKTNPWAAPFLHPRFYDIVQFRLWNTTEQLDGVPELKDEWRLKGTLFNSGGHVINVPPKRLNTPGEVPANWTASIADASQGEDDDDDMLNRAGSKSSSSYDRLSVILSDMARFILCHRFGGIYLDADTIFLRDWEELWGWKGAFAYRWSRLDKYNTAVLRLNKGSALGTFLFRTAAKNDFDFHPMTVSKYTKEAYLDNLLLRLPDALFDPAWLNTEYYQRDRPPQPFLSE